MTWPPTTNVPPGPENWQQHLEKIRTEEEAALLNIPPGEWDEVPDTMKAMHPKLMAKIAQVHRPVGERKCARCGEVKFLEDFYHYKGKPISYCKPCNAEYHREQEAKKTRARES